MIRGIDPADPGRGGFWWTPGGGLDEGESLEAGTCRELWEEVGLRVDPADLGPVVLERDGTFPFGGRWVHQTEQVFAITVPERFEPQPQQWEQLEVDAIRELRWLSIDDLHALAEPHHPRCLIPLLEHLAAHGPPAEPWVEVQPPPT
jgi:8-oxo-dGTP pyrophosphatase MutT (NUDIX family)